MQFLSISFVVLCILVLSQMVQSASILMKRKPDCSAAGTYPHPDSCRMYYNCKLGERPSEETCPGDSGYSEDLRRCVKMSRIVCDKNR